MRAISRQACGALLASLPWAAPAHSILIASEEVRLETPHAVVTGTLMWPALTGEPLGCAVIAGGTLSHTRDGGFEMPGAPRRDTLARLAAELAHGGWASLRWDRVGHGESSPAADWDGSYAHETEVLEAALAFVRETERFRPCVVIGESAGAYLACLAAERGAQADGYVFLGPLACSPEVFYEYTFGLLREHAASSPAAEAWAEAAAPEALRMARHHHALWAAARRGEAEFSFTEGSQEFTWSLARRREEIERPPDAMFRFITSPALCLAGEFDLNVPPWCAARAAAIMQEAGNLRARSVLLPGVDHSFQLVPLDEHQRIRERFTFESFTRPHAPALPSEILSWLHVTFGTAPPSVESPSVPPPPERATASPEIDERTAFAPRTVHLAPGVEIVEAIDSPEAFVGVPTLEGIIGPVLLGEDCQAHFIELQPGMFAGEHPHRTESLIFTVRGQWVLTSAGRRHLIRPGTLFHFGAGRPTGYEVPFGEPAYILIFKGQRSTEQWQDFIDYLTGYAERMRAEHAEGVPYLFRDLPADHPACLFGRQVNPGFDRLMEAWAAASPEWVQP